MKKLFLLASLCLCLNCFAQQQVLNYVPDFVVSLSQFPASTSVIDGYIKIPTTRPIALVSVSMQLYSASNTNGLLNNSDCYIFMGQTTLGSSTVSSIMKTVTVTSKTIDQSGLYIPISINTPWYGYIPVVKDGLTNTAVLYDIYYNGRIASGSTGINGISLMLGFKYLDKPGIPFYTPN